MLFSKRKLEISSKEYWTYSESYFPNCFVSPWGPNQLCQIVSNHEYVSVYSEYLNLGGILSHFVSISSHQSWYVCVVRVIQCRYILIQNTFITEASYGKFFFHYSFAAFNFHNVDIAEIFRAALCQNMLQTAFFVFCQLWIFK